MQSIVIHAGAGCVAPRAEAEAVRLDAIKRALLAAREALVQTSSLSEAVIAALIVMEDDEHCNAGYGSNLTEDGSVECDASIMEGDYCGYGACGAVPGVANPIRLAARLLACQRGPARPLGLQHPMLLVGPGAQRWAGRNGVNVVDEEALVSARSHRTWRRMRDDLSDEEAAQAAKRRRRSSDDGTHPPKRDDAPEAAPMPLEGRAYDTVGVVACDGAHVVAASSSGGIWLKASGRVGSAALFGAGCWAADAVPAHGAADDGAAGGPCGATARAQHASATVGASASGVGEEVVQALLAQQFCLAIAQSDVSIAATAKELLCGRQAGVVALRSLPDPKPPARHGMEIIIAHSTPAFVVGHLDVDVAGEAGRDDSLQDEVQQPQPQAFISRCRRRDEAGADAADDERPEVLRIPCGSRAERSEKVQETS